MATKKKPKPKWDDPYPHVRVVWIDSARPLETHDIPLDAISSLKPQVSITSGHLFSESEDAITIIQTITTERDLADAPISIPKVAIQEMRLLKSTDRSAG